MIHFAVYDPSSGAIRRYGSCMQVDLAHQAGPGEAVIETPAPAPDDKFTIDISKTPPTLAAAN